MDVLQEVTMRAPEALRDAVLTTFDKPQPDWVYMTQAMVLFAEGIRVSSRDMAQRWGVSKSKAAILMQEARTAGCAWGVLEPTVMPADEA